MEERIRDLEIKMTKVSGDIEHIKDRVDNGMSITLTNIYTKLEEYLPKVKENSWWVGQIKRAVIYISVITLGGSLVGLFFTLVNKGLGQ